MPTQTLALARGEAHLYRRYTGNPPAYLKNPCSPRPLPLNDVPTHGQEALEHQVFLGLRGGGLHCAHPLSIAWTRVLADRTVVRLDRVGMSSGHRYDMADWALLMLPNWTPSEQPGEAVHGTLGMRASVDAEGLRVTSAEYPGAVVVLTGPSPQHWQRRLLERVAELKADGRQPLWELPQFSAPEQAHRSVLLPRELWGWVGAGLLRRIGLFASPESPAYSAHYWESWAGTLSLELIHVHPALPGHDRLVADLVDNDFGLPAVIVDQHCSCRRSRSDRPYTRDATYSRHCHTTLAHRDGLPGRLHLRFASSSARRGASTDAAVDELRRQLALVGAPRGWLGRVLPSAEAAEPTAPLADRRMACTGERRHEAADGIAKSGGKAFPVPGFAQMRLESEIALGLGGLWGSTEQPMGIRAVRPAADLLVINLEARAAVARYWGTLLPTPGLPGSAGQVPGLRYELQPDGLHLVRVEPGGDEGRVLVTGIPANLWSSSLAATGPAARQGAPWSGTELADFAAAPDRGVEFCFGSGLLRMVNALRGPARSTAARLTLEADGDGSGRWRNIRWVLEISHGPDHDTLLRLLTDSDLALRLELGERVCACAAGRGTCTLTLHGYGQSLVIRDLRGAPDGADGRATQDRQRRGAGLNAARG